MTLALPDIPRLYTALAEWLACMVYILALPRRLHGWRLLLCAGGGLIVLAAFLVLTGDLPIAFWIPCMVAALGLMLLQLAVCCRVTAMDAVYYCIQAFVLAEFAASLEWQLSCFLTPEQHTSIRIELGLLTGVFLTVFVLMWNLLRRLSVKSGSLNASWREVGSAAIIGAAVFALSNLSFLTVDTPFSAQYGPEICNVRTMMDLGGLAILYAHHLQCRDLRVLRELEAVQNVLHKHYQQYQMSRESIDLINRKYHDLKHQVALLRAQSDAAQRDAYLSQMEEEIGSYEAQNKTGNQVLDTVLTSKSLSCAQQGIALTCVADGVVLTRVGGEDKDVAMYSADGRHMLGLSAEEEALMDYLRSQKAAGVFGRIVVVLNTDFQMELGWLDEYDVDACVLAGVTGATGFEGVANVLAGNVNPSGRLVDTYAANSLSAPAVTYAGDNTRMWGNADEVNANSTDVSNNGAHIDHYVIYAEGIYVGYKYYETRYEDAVMGAGGADSSVGSSFGGAWDYSSEMVYPFGYGLSYTTFAQELQSVNYDIVNGCYEVEVKVTNTGSVPGKSVVQVYAQTPYGDYEKQNLVEKSAIQLVGFGKTDELAPGASELVTIAVDHYMLASYDAHGAKGYILSAGDYYLSVGDDAHDALNNILAAKGYTTADGMTAPGSADKTYRWNQAVVDTQSYRLSAYTGEEITNRFDFGDLSYYGIDFTYMTRSDWAGTFPAEAVVLNATEEMIRDLNSGWYQTPEDAPAVDSFTQGAENGLSFIDMRLVDFDDDETWNAFLDQLTVSEMLSLVSDSKSVGGIDRIGLPAQVRDDDNLSAGTIAATGNASLSWVSEVVTSRTWNPELFTSRGRYLALESAFCGLNEIWYGGGNIHRTPFGGRASQYYSEDGSFGYLVGKHEAEAMQANGINYAVKHFVMNDQETCRESLATFASEQTIREEYLRSFEGSLAAGGALSVMTAFNRIGVTYVATCVELLTDVLRGEWGYKGHITTDAFNTSSLYKTHYLEMCSAGITFYCLDPGYNAAAIEAAINAGDGNMLRVLRGMTKYNIYAAAHSVSVNGLNSNSIVVTVVPWWETAMLAATAVFALGFVVCLVGCVIGVCTDGRRAAPGKE